MPRRGENIRKRKDGRWEGRYIKGYDSVKGKVKYASVYAKSYKDVKLKLNEAKYKTSIEVKYADAKNKLYGELLNDWLSAESKNLKPSSVIKYQKLIEKHIIPKLGHRKLSELNADVFNLFLEDQSSYGNIRTGGELSASTIQTIIYILKATVRYAASKDMIDNISFRWTKNKNPASPIQILERQEEEALDSFLSKHITRRNLGIMLSLYCGLRIGEVCALQWTDIDLHNAILYVRHTVQRLSTPDGNNKTAIYIGSPKSKSSIRTIPVPAFLMPIIAELGKNDLCDAYILTGSTEEPMEPRTLQYIFQRILEKNKIKKKKYHILRHTFATNCIALGFDVKSLSEILGHSNVGITLNKYVHPSVQHKKIQMDKWNAIKGQVYGQK